jgi:ABC-type nitrate/sulfonate/bicarbonate transport system substrate-binding protein
MIRNSGRIATLALVGIVAITLAGCSSTSSPATSSSSPKAGPLPTLSVGTAAPLTNFADVYVAEQKGYFKDAGVNVTIQSGVGAAGLNSIVSGQLDLLMFGTGQALIPAARGIQTKIVYNQIGAGEGATIAVAYDSPYKTVSDLSGKSVAVLGVGGSSYGWGEYFSHYSASHGGAAYNVVQSPSTTDQVNGVLSGHFDALVSTASLLSSQVASKQVRLLVNPATASAKKYIGSQYAEDVTFGVEKNLKGKGVAISRFVAGMQAADKWMLSSTPAQIAKVLKTSSAFDGQTLATVTVGAAYDKHFFAPSLGKISSKLWTSTLKQMAFWGLPNVNLKAATYSYAQRVDMSYLNAAAKIKISTSSK